MKIRSENELIDLYVMTYPFLSALATRRDDRRTRKQLGDMMARLAYPKGINGPEAMIISSVGLIA